VTPSDVLPPDSTSRPNGADSKAIRSLAGLTLEVGRCCSCLFAFCGRIAHVVLLDSRPRRRIPA
jgi:hypothetical protein